MYMRSLAALLSLSFHMHHMLLSRHHSIKQRARLIIMRIMQISAGAHSIKVAKEIIIYSAAPRSKAFHTGPRPLPSRIA